MVFLKIPAPWFPATLWVSGYTECIEYKWGKLLMYGRRSFLLTWFLILNSGQIGLVFDLDGIRQLIPLAMVESKNCQWGFTTFKKSVTFENK